MKVSMTIAATAASVVMLTSAASAQTMERRDFYDPLGVWSERGHAPQQQIFAPGPPSKVGSAVPSHFNSPDTNWQGNNWNGRWNDRNW